MGIKIGTNFNYQGSYFLDARQGMPKTLSDLLNWDILVPVGFEVVVDGEWYTYKGEGFWLPETGHWQKRADAMRDYGKEIEKLMAAVFPMTLTVSGGGTYTEGSSVSVEIRWTLRKESKLYTPDKVEIDGLVVPQPELGHYTLPTRLKNSHTYTVRVWYDDAVYSGQVEYTFKNKKYWGVISDPAEFQDVYGLFNSWSDSWKLDETKFDCTGGWYPVYVIPREMWPGENTFSLWVGGFQSSDYTHSTMTLLNEAEKPTNYEVIVLNRKQTGILNIRVGNQD